GRITDVASDLGVVAQAVQYVRSDRGRGALAFGAGDACHAVERHVFQPQPEATAHRDAGPFKPGDLGAVPTDARALDHHVTRQQRLEPTAFGGQDVDTLQG